MRLIKEKNSSSSTYKIQVPYQNKINIDPNYILFHIETHAHTFSSISVENNSIYVGQGEQNTPIEKS